MTLASYLLATVAAADELCAYAGTLAKIRLIQIEIDATTSYTGAPKAALLSPALLT